MGWFPRGSFGRALGLGILLQGLATLVTGWDDPSAGEPLFWRWLRVLVEHPLRGAIGLGLVLRAASPQRADSSPDDP